MSLRLIILKVRVSIFVLDIPEVQDHSARSSLMFWKWETHKKPIFRNGMEITIDFYFRQFWTDHRLRLDPKVSFLLLFVTDWKDKNRATNFER